MRIINLQQGTAEWHAWRREKFTASDAAAMLGISMHKSRPELLAEKATGIEKEYDEATLARFALGHRLEEAARPLAEKVIAKAYTGDPELYPVVAECDAIPALAASFDGVTMDDSVIWEHKTNNEDYRKLDRTVGGEIDPENLPDFLTAQIQQQLMVSGAEKCLFMATDETGSMVFSWVAPDPKWHQRIVDGWLQFEKDLSAWTPTQESAPALEGRAPERLPALRIEVMGRVTASNLPEFKQSALAIIDSVNTDLSTDQDFEDAKEAVKWCREAESRLVAAKSAALAQTASIDELFRTVESIGEALKVKRRRLETLVETRNKEIRMAAVMRANQAFVAHRDALDGEFAYGLRLTFPAPDFGGAIKGMKKIANMDAALNAALANGKIAADRLAAEWREKLRWLDENAAEHRFLLADLQQIISKPLEDFKLTVLSRIDAHKKAEAEKIERIRREEAAKLAEQQRAEANQKAEAERLEAERVKAEAESKAANPRPLAVATSAPESNDATPEMESADIRAFLNVRDFGKEAGKIRAVLVEFVKFCKQQALLKKAA